MRDLINNDKLHQILDIIEENLQYEIKSEPMHSDAEITTNGGIYRRPSDNHWTLLVHSKVNMNQSMICHELMHVALWLDGYPIFTFNRKYQRPDHLDPYMVLANMLRNLVAHIKVWELTTLLGFDEGEFYSNEISTKFIPDVENNVFFDPVPVSPELNLFGGGAFLAQGLLCPAREPVKQLLRHAAHKSSPAVLILADIIAEVVRDKYAPICAQSFAPALSDALHIVGLPPDMWMPSFRPEPPSDVCKKLCHLQ